MNYVTGKAYSVAARYIESIKLITFTVKTWIPSPDINEQTCSLQLSDSVYLWYWNWQTVHRMFVRKELRVESIKFLEQTLTTVFMLMHIKLDDMGKQ